MNKQLQEQLEEIQNPVLKEHLSTMTRIEFQDKQVGTRAVLRTLPTARSPNLTPEKEYEIQGKYRQGFIIEDDSGRKNKVFYEWFQREKPLP